MSAGRSSVSQVLFFLAAIGVISGAVGVVVAAQPVLRGARARRAPALARGAVPALRAEFVAAIQVVVYAGAVMVLYVFVVAYVGDQTEPLGERLLGSGPAGPRLAPRRRDRSRARCSSSS